MATLSAAALPRFTWCMTRTRGSPGEPRNRKSTRLNSSHGYISYAVFCLKKKTLRYPKDVVEDAAQLVALHLRFHGYGLGEWTDSAGRPYVHDAGPLLDRLQLLLRSDLPA